MNQSGKHDFTCDFFTTESIEKTGNVFLFLDNGSVSEKFNNYFSQIVDSLSLYQFHSKLSREYADEIDNIMPKFKTHLSIIKIKKYFKINTAFSFSPTSKDEIVAIIKGLQNNKAAGGEIPSNILN